MSSPSHLPSRLSSIAFVVCHFGALRPDMDLWLASCAANPTVDWLLFIDDDTPHPYPPNVHVTLTSFEEVARRLRACFDVPVALSRPYKLCDFKPVYGEAFASELAGYDFWGHCDLDMIWGNLRAYLTEEVLAVYEKLGFVGHCTLYRNTPENNRRYRAAGRAGEPLWEDALCDEASRCFDEVGMNDIFLAQGLPIWRDVVFADLASSGLRENFGVCFLPRSWRSMNRSVAFEWDEGHLYQLFLYKKLVLRTEVMFVHLLGSRQMAVQTSEGAEGAHAHFLMVPGAYVDAREVTPEWLRERTRPHWARFMVRGVASRLAHPRALAGWARNFAHATWEFYARPELYNYWRWSRNPSDEKVGRMRLLGPDAEGVRPEVKAAPVSASVSVIVPVYNVEVPLVRRCLESVVAQTHPGVDAVLVDDGSTPELAHAYEGVCHELGVRYLARPHGGPSAARNTGIEATDGEWLCFTDADDIMEHHMVEVLLEAAWRHDADAAAGGFDRIEKLAGRVPLEERGPDLVLTGEQEAIWMLRQPGSRREGRCYLSGACWGMLFRRAEAAWARFDENTNAGEDTLYLLEVLPGLKRVVVVDELAYHYVLRPGSLSRAKITPEVLWSRRQTADLFLKARQRMRGRLGAAVGFSSATHRVNASFIERKFLDERHDGHGRLTLSEIAQLLRGQRISELPPHMCLKLALCAGPRWMFRVALGALPAYKALRALIRGGRP